VALDPDAAQILKMVAEAKRPPLHTLPVPEARKAFGAMRHVLTPDPPAVDEARDLKVPGPHGDVPARFYRPKGSAGATLPVIVYFHGGGWVLGDLDTHDYVSRELANRAGAAVLSVDYRLAPEHKFPAAVDDAFAAYRWANGEGASRLGVDGARIAVAGDSAGGNLSAVVSLMARDTGTAGSLRGQVLAYPAIDMRGDYPSMREFGEGHLLERAGMDWFYGHYLRRAEEKLDWRASPLLASRHDGLAPALVMTGGCDPLRDEGKAYADRLAAAGNKVTYRCFDGLLHGFLQQGKIVRASDEALATAAAFLRQALKAG
jgi:acetyl esterase